jgi:hypothetical protein
MILIFTEEISYSAKYVTRHLHRLNQKFEVFLNTDVIEFKYEINNTHSNIQIYKNGCNICSLNEVTTVWAHRSPINVSNKIYNLKTIEERQYINRNIETQINSIKYYLENKKCLGKFEFYNFNKIVFLEVCKELNLKIPTTLISTSKDELISFYNNQKQEIIVKSLARNFTYRNEKGDDFEVWQKGVTKQIDIKSIEQLPIFFDLSLFQEKLNKKYELRILYINQVFFGQIIFSQSLEVSKLDYRQGIGSKMRQCNFELDEKLKFDIKRLMIRLGLNMGCIDVVVDENDDYVFLEVNPSGIFTDMMDNCNYDMHYEIVKFLINEK